MKKQIKSRSSEETWLLGKALGKQIFARTTIALFGSLGTGKTTFVQGVAAGLEVPDTYYVTSPTYTIVNEYPGRLPLIHMDLYRLASDEELDGIGFDDLVSSLGTIIIEWPGIIDKKRLFFDLEFYFETDAEFNRDITIISSGLAGKNLLNNLVY